MKQTGRDWNIFFCSVFFVLGFSLVFSLVGVLLQSVLASVSFTVERWLGRIGGIVIIFFGLYLLGLIRPKFLEQEHKLHLKGTYGSRYLTSFVFGAAFAVGWTPCVGPVLGAILTLAVTNPGSAFFLMLSYSIGLGIPFLLVGLFTNQAKELIRKGGKWIQYANYAFGGILILMGILVFTGQLARIANLALASDIILALSGESITFGGSLNIFIAFLAGVISFLSPCVLPLIPAFLTYLASVAIKK